MADRLRGRAGMARRQRILVRDRYTCCRCGRVCEPKRLRADHTNPLALGGSDDDDDNLRTLCIPCHDAVTAEQFGHAAPIEARGVGRDGRPTDPAHPWNRATETKP
jgi:5-methylcytosine-specific restriction protein A